MRSQPTFVGCIARPLQQRTPNTKTSGGGSTRGLMSERPCRLPVRMRRMSPFTWSADLERSTGTYKGANCWPYQFERHLNYCKWLSRAHNRRMTKTKLSLFLIGFWAVLYLPLVAISFWRVGYDDTIWRLLLAVAGLILGLTMFWWVSRGENAEPPPRQP